jgi:GT2 family glycosyltransferase
VNPAVDLSIVISNYNSWRFLEPCLRSLLDDLEDERFTWEIVVVDDASSDGSAEKTEAAFPAARVIRTPRNLGYAGANNLGMREAAGRLVLLLNADTVVHDGALRALVQAIDASPQIGGVGPTLRNPDGTLQRSCFRFPMPELLGNALSLFRAGLLDDYRAWRHDADRDVECMSSAALLVSHAALDRIGLFDERFWVYGVDIDWALRARRRGLRLRTIAAAQITHYGESTSIDAPDRVYWGKLSANDALFRKHYGAAGWLVFRATLLVSALPRLLVWSALRRLGRARASGRAKHFARLLRWSLLGRRAVETAPGAARPRWVS